MLELKVIMNQIMAKNLLLGISADSWPDPWTTDLVTFTEEVLNGKLYFLFSVFFLDSLNQFPLLLEARTELIEFHNKYWVKQVVFWHLNVLVAVQKMKFSIKNFLRKYDYIN